MLEIVGVLGEGAEDGEEVGRGREGGGQSSWRSPGEWDVSAGAAEGERLAVDCRTGRLLAGEDVTLQLGPAVAHGGPGHHVPAGVVAERSAPGSGGPSGPSRF